MTFDLNLWPFDRMNIWRFPYYISKPSLVQIRLQFFKWDHFHIFSLLTTWPQVAFDLGIWPLTTWTYKGSHIISRNQVWFQLDFNFSNEATFTFSAYLTIWPQMTFDLNMWSLTSSTNEGSHIASDPTLVEIHQSMWKLEPNVNLFSQQQTTTKEDNSGQSDPSYWKLLAWNEQKRFHSSRCACQRSLFVLWPLLHACVSPITHTDVHTNCPRMLHADRYLTQYFWDSLTGNVKMPVIGLKMPCPSSQPMSLSLISNENIFSLVSYTMRRFSVSQTSAFCWRFLHCDPTKIGASLHWNILFC